MSFKKSQKVNFLRRCCSFTSPILFFHNRKWTNNGPRINRFIGGTPRDFDDRKWTNNGFNGDFDCATSNATRLRIQRRFNYARHFGSNKSWWLWNSKFYILLSTLIFGSHLQMKNYVATQIAAKLPIGSDLSRADFDAAVPASVAILGFSDSSINIMSYFEAKDLATVKDAIDKLSLSETKTNPARALNMFKQINPKTNINAMMVLASG